VRYVHEGGFLLWLSQALLLPDLLVSLAVGPERRSALGIAVLLLEVIYVWLVLYGSWWAIKFARRGPTRA
jgi:hypothetical protein